MSEHISGIQQVGVGIPNVHEAWKWYRENFSIDVPIFEEAATADLMLPYTGGKPHDRHAILALSMQGGGGFEIWQYTSRTPQAPSFQPELGDLGICVCKLKSNNIDKAFTKLNENGATLSSKVQIDSKGKKHFFVSDPYGNVFQIVECDDFYKNDSKPTGGVSGVGIGVSDIEKSIRFYSNVLGYSHVVRDEIGVFILPGHTMHTTIPSSLCSKSRVPKYPSKACLEAEYDDRNGKPNFPAMELITAIVPPFFSNIHSKMWRVNSIVPK